MEVESEHSSSSVSFCCALLLEAAFSVVQVSCSAAGVELDWEEQASSTGMQLGKVRHLGTLSCIKHKTVLTPNLYSNKAAKSS